MATREITKSSSQYDELELHPELVPAPEEPSGDESTTVAKLSRLWGQRRILWRAAAIGLAVSTVTAFLIPARYTSTARLMPPDQAGAGFASMLAAFSHSGGGGSGELASIGGDLFGLKTSGDLFVGVLKSETVENAIINKFDLRHVYWEKRYLDARKVLESRTDIVADRKSGIITIAVSDRDPDLAAQIGQEYVAQLNKVVITLDTSTAHRERVFLEERLNEVQRDLEAAEKEFSQYASKNASLDVKEQGKAMIGAAAELEGQLIAAQTQLEGLRQIYTPNNVRVRTVQARVDEYRRQLQKMGGDVPVGVGSTASFQPPDGQTSATANQDLYPSIRQLPILGVEWADLYRRTKVEEAVFETLTKQFEMAKVEEAKEIPSIKVLDVPQRPEKKSFPPRMIIIGLGTCFVFAMGAVWVLARERWQEIDPADPGKKLAEEVYRTVRTNVIRISSFVSRKEIPHDAS